MDPTPLVVVVMAFFGVVQMFWPKRFAGGMRAYVCRTFDSATPEQAQRLSGVLAARDAAEAGSSPYVRLSGAFALCMAAAVYAFKVPILTAWGIACFGTAIILTLAYGEFRRPTERRAASLAPRTPRRSFSPFVLANAALCAFGGIQLLVFPQWRLGVAILLAAEAIVLFLAWRIASSPARLLGEDPEVENLVDERVRYFRANAVALGASVPLYAVVSMTGWYAPHSDYYPYLHAAVVIALNVTFWSLLLQMRKPLAFR